MSPELETLDQLLGGDLPIGTLRKLYPDSGSFNHGIVGLLNNEDVRLLASDGSEVPSWRWRELFHGEASADQGFVLSLTDKGGARIA